MCYPGIVHIFFFYFYLPSFSLFPSFCFLLSDFSVILELSLNTFSFIFSFIFCFSVSFPSFSFVCYSGIVFNSLSLFLSFFIYSFIYLIFSFSLLSVSYVTLKLPINYFLSFIFSLVFFIPLSSFFLSLLSFLSLSSVILKLRSNLF